MTEQPAGPPSVPRGLVVAAAIGWRVLVVAAAVLVVGLVLAELRVAFLAVFLAVFATALLRPPCEWLKRAGWPPVLAALATLASGLALLAAVLWVILPPFARQLDDLGDELSEGVAAVGDWLVDGPVGLSRAELDDYVDSAVEAVQDNTEAILSGVLAGAQIVVEGIAIFLIAVVLTFFLLKDGDRIRDWLIGLFAPERRDHVAEIGARSWGTLTGYLRGMTIVALFDAAFIGIALVIVGVPAALPLAVLTFFGAYIPIAGAFVTGIAAVFVALIALGLIEAIVIAAAVIAVQQIESNALHPFVVGRAVAVHPIAILLAVTCGALIAGILGAFVAVPIAAVAARVGGYLREQAPEHSLKIESIESS